MYECCIYCLWRYGCCCGPRGYDSDVKCISDVMNHYSLWSLPDYQAHLNAWPYLPYFMVWSFSSKRTTCPTELVYQDNFVKRVKSLKWYCYKRFEHYLVLYIKIFKPRYVSLLGYNNQHLPSYLVLYIKIIFYFNTGVFVFVVSWYWLHVQMSIL